MRKKLLILAIILLLSPLVANAAIYYVDKDSVGGTCNDSNAGTITEPWCTIQKANSTLAAGDTIRLRVGTYPIDDDADYGIRPGVTGTSGNRITYEAYNSEAVVFEGASTSTQSCGMMFGIGNASSGESDGRNYITIKDITFQNLYKWLDWRFSSYNELDSCTFDHWYGSDTSTSVNWPAAYILYTSTHNWIHGCVFKNYGAFTESYDKGPMLEIGIGSGVNADHKAHADYNTVEDCHLYNGGHHVFGLNSGQYNVIKNNYMHGESWSLSPGCEEHPGGTCGYRIASMTCNTGYGAGNNLLEKNRFGYGAQYGGPHLAIGGSGSGLTVGTSTNIVRYNDFFANVLYGMRTGSSISGSDDNRIYNNTFYSHGWNRDEAGGSPVEDDSRALDNARMSFSLYKNTGCGSGTYAVEGNVVKNNLTHDTWSETHHYSTSSYYAAFCTGGVAACNTVTNNWGNVGTLQGSAYTPAADPKFVDPDISDPSAGWPLATAKPDLSLQSDSPVINQGTYLTQADGSSDGDETPSTTLIVDDALYFQDGSWGSSLATLAADYVAVGTVSNTAQISSIDYGTNTITLDSALTWSDNANIWLYKDSDGVIVLKGVAPDMGAHEATPAGAASGTIFPGGCTESNIDGKTIDVTLVNATWHADLGADNAQSTAFIDGFDAATSQTNGWNNEIRDKLTYTAVTRVSAIVARLTIAIGSYDIAENEVVTFTAAAATHSEVDNIVATPTFQISAEQIGAESLSAVYDATGPSVTYDATGPAVIAP